VKRPAFQFYPADWRKDMALQSCSVAARGLWVDMLCIAHECEPYGHLTVNGKAMTAAQIGRHTGLTERECSKLLGELADSGVSSVTSEGVIFSRRMVRDEEIRNKRAEGGKAGSEHGAKGAEHGIKGGRPPKTRGVSEAPLEPPPSSSSSSSSSTSVEEETQSSTVAQAPAAKQDLTPDEIIFGYGVPLLVQAGNADRAARSFLGKLRKLHGDETVINTLRQCLKAKPLQPLEWLAKALPPKAAAPSEVSEAARREAENAKAAALLGFNNGEVIDA
jgi:hypothetical protein